MQFISFKVSETEAINQFLKDNHQGIPAKGIYFHEGNLCFIYTDSSESYQEKESLKASAKEFISKILAEAAGVETDIRYWKWQARRGAQGAGKNIVDNEGKKEALLKQVQFARDMIIEIENGTWPPAPSESVASEVITQSEPSNTEEPKDIVPEQENKL